MSEQATIDAADKVGANLITVLGEVFTQPASAYAIFFAFGAAYMYSLFADDKLTKANRRKKKAIISFTSAVIIFLAFSEGTLHREAWIVAFCVGFAAVMLPLLILKLLEAYAPKLAYVIEPDQKRRQLRKATKADIDNPDKDIYTDTTQMIHKDD